MEELDKLLITPQQKKESASRHADIFIINANREMTMYEVNRREKINIWNLNLAREEEILRVKSEAPYDPNQSPISKSNSKRKKNNNSQRDNPEEDSETATVKSEITLYQARVETEKDDDTSQ